MNSSTAIKSPEPFDYVEISIDSIDQGGRSESQPHIQYNRMVGAFVVMGKTPSQIAELVGISEDQVRILLRQPATSEIINELASSDIDDATENILNAARLDTILTLFKIRDDASCAPSVRLSACKEILDRASGRPVTSDKKTMSTGLGLPNDPLDAAKVLDEQIAALNARKDQL